MFARDPEKMDSFLGADSNFKGELKVKGTLRVDGSVEGHLNADCVILSERASVKGEVLGKKLAIGGTVEGIVRAAELVEIKSQGKVRGDIFTPQLIVAEGAQFNGKIEMAREGSKVIDLPLKEQEA
jgi:cytoskeletal protein CcmA (bactofilin family)